jgi:hypothetical protein
MKLKVFTILGLFIATNAFAETINFDQEKLGAPPHGWLAG